MPKELLFRVTIHDCEVQTFRSGGKGGQNQNKRNTGVRVVHRPSGAVGESREERGQLANKRRAFVRMAKSEKFEIWRRAEVAKILMLYPRSLDETVDAMMTDENLMVEYR